MPTETSHPHTPPTQPASSGPTVPSSSCPRVGESRRRAFTLVELVVVIVILAILAGVIVPRMISWDSRRTDQTIRAVETLLSSAAQRTVTSTQTIALQFDAEANVLRLLWKKPEDPRSFDLTQGVWQPDNLAPQVKLDSLTLARAVSGQSDFGSRSFRAALQDQSAAGGRVPIALLIRDERADRAWLIRLSAGSSRATIIANATEADLSAPDPEIIDLDALGKREEPW